MAVVAIFALVALVFIVMMMTGDDEGTTTDTPSPVETTSMRVVDDSFLLG